MKKFSVLSLITIILLLSGPINVFALDKSQALTNKTWPVISYVKGIAKETRDPTRKITNGSYLPIFTGDISFYLKAQTDLTMPKSSDFGIRLINEKGLNEKIGDIKVTSRPARDLRVGETAKINLSLKASLLNKKPGQYKFVVERIDWHTPGGENSRQAVGLKNLETYPVIIKSIQSYRENSASYWPASIFWGMERIKQAINF